MKPSGRTKWGMDFLDYNMTLSLGKPMLKDVDI